MNLKDYLNSLPRGGWKAFSDELGVSMSYLSQMASGLAPISPKRCVQIEMLSGGVVSRQILKPDDFSDIWPELAEAPTKQ